MKSGYISCGSATIEEGRFLQGRVLRRSVVVGLLLIAAASLTLSLNFATAAQEASSSDAAKGALQAVLVVQTGHSTRDITSVAFSPDGKYILTGSNDATARLWEIETGREIRTIKGHADLVTSVAYSPDGMHVITGSWDKTARIWEVETGRETRRLDGHSNVVESVAYSPDGKHVLTGSWDMTARIWDVEAGKEIRKLEGHSGGIYAVTFSPDGLNALTGAHDQTARLWEWQTGTEVRKFVHREYVTSVAYSPDGRRVLTGSWDKTARIWDVETGREIQKLEGHTYHVKSVAYSPDGQHVITGSLDKTARIWSVRTGREVRKLWGHFVSGGSVLSVAYSPDGRQVVTGGRDSKALVWAVDTDDFRRLDGYSSGVSSVVYSPDGKHVLIASHDLTARIWDLETGGEARIFKGHTNFISSVAYSPDGKYVLTGSFDKTARLWEVETGREARKLEGHSNLVKSVAYSPDGKHVLTGGMDSTARIWEAETGKEIRKLEGPSDVRSVAYSPHDGNQILTVSSDDTARLWEVETGRELRQFERVSNVEFSPDGSTILNVSLDGYAQLWERSTGREIRRLELSKDVTGVTYARGGKLVLMSNNVITVRLKDEGSGKEIRLEGNLDQINDMTYSPDGRHVLTAGEDSTVRIWDRSSGKELCRLVSFRDGNWVVVDPAGRFDTSNLEEVKGLHWIVSDDPMKPLPLEIFMRDYYEPRLLPRILNGDQFNDVRDIARLNRTRPQVAINSIVQQKGNPDLVTVTVEVAKASGVTRNGPEKKISDTGVYDVRLFREGRVGSRVTLNRQIVGQIPGWSDPVKNDANELLTWRQISQIDLDRTGKQTIKFENIQLPRANVSEVEFSVYAFNEDRIKTATDRKTFSIPTFQNVLGRAYLISVGVNSFENPAWNLQFAANDARLTQQVLFEKLSEQKFQFDEIVQVPLISDAQANENRATKANFKTVLDLLAGKTVETERIKEIPNAAKIKQAAPGDLVIISFSSHGYADRSGGFYLFPSDSGKQGRDSISDQMKEKLISSEELSLWLRDVDAGEMVMIVDACHAAAAVGGQFKPGPMGSRGLGQLSYDKGMRIVAATQADRAAIEVGGALAHGLLSYALFKEGLGGGKANFKAGDEKQLTLRELLEYGVQRVPQLYREVVNGNLKAVNKDVFIDEVSQSSGYSQQPSLFDFARRTDFTLIYLRP